MTTAPAINAARRLRQERDAAVDPAVFDAALDTLATNVVVVTSRDDEGPFGLTASSFVSLARTPPLVGFSVAASFPTWRRLRRVASLLVHLLGEDQHDLARRFADRTVDRFAPPTRWRGLPTGEPRLEEASGWLRGRTEEHIALGDHHLVVVRVLEAAVPADQWPLLYHQRTYRALREPSP
jgi:flavin reductase (DIM6/NTAB) family NADH-FMN oxidoreductase RutF